MDKKCDFSINTGYVKLCLIKWNNECFNKNMAENFANFIKIINPISVTGISEGKVVIDYSDLPEVQHEMIKEWYNFEYKKASCIVPRFELIYSVFDENNKINYSALITNAYIDYIKTPFLTDIIIQKPLKIISNSIFTNEKIDSFAKEIFKKGE